MGKYVNVFSKTKNNLMHVDIIKATILNYKIINNRTS